MEIILAYEKKMPDGEFLPNGMTEEIYHEWKNKKVDEISVYQFHQEYMEKILKGQGAEVKLMTVDEAINTKKNFIYLFECHASTYNWLGYYNKKGRDIFSFFSEKALDAIRSKQCKVIFHAGTEGTEGTKIKELITVSYLNCCKYDINPRLISYVSGNMKFVESFNMEKESFFHDGFIKPYQTPYFWDAAKFIYSGHKNLENRLVSPRVLKTPKNKKELRYLCFNKVPRGHRYLVAMHLWKYHREKGLLSMSDWDHDSMVYWGSWHRHTDEIEKYKEIEKEFKKDLPLTVDVTYKIGDENSHTTWLMNSWPYLQTNFSIVTETSNSTCEIFITEKTFKVIANMQPFVMLGNRHIIRTLKDLGFKTFHPIINEDYDNIEDTKERLKAVIDEIDRLCSMDWEEFYEKMRILDEITIYNYNHFWNNGDFTRKLFERIINV